MKIAFCASEAVPFVKTGGLADVCGALPLELAELGHEVALVLPCYRAVRASGAAIKTLDADFDFTTLAGRARVYFVKHDSYLREGLYGDRFGDYGDNLRRFSYLCEKTLQLFAKIHFLPDVIHVHDWQTALVPLYLKERGRRYFPKTARVPKTILTIHNVSYQGMFPKEQMPDSGLGWEYFSLSGLEFYDKINLLKGGILYSDAINTVSHTHSYEMQTEEFGCGLEGVLRLRRERFSGILNGIDYKVWNPQGDRQIFKNYSASHPQDKKLNKVKLQEACRLIPGERRFVAGFVGRLVEQKGIDLVVNILPHMVASGMQAVILGAGEVRYENIFTDMARRYPGSVFFSQRFDDELAHRIYAGADIFLMPSCFEPCGIGQMISFKYGTVPVVHRTGGLADTVTDYDVGEHSGTGFVAPEYHGESFLLAVRRAHELFGDVPRWQGLIHRIMRLNFSWRESARKYVELYEKAVAASS